LLLSSVLSVPPPPTSTLFPYTTLFRSPSIRTNLDFGCDTGLVSGRLADIIHKCTSDKRKIRPLRGRTWLRGDHLIISWTRLSCRSEEHTSELQSHLNLVCRLLLEKKKQ